MMHSATRPVEFLDIFHPADPSPLFTEKEKEPGPLEGAELFSRTIRPGGGRAGWLVGHALFKEMPRRRAVQGLPNREGWK